MIARSDTSPIIMVAPNGARKGKIDHPQLPVTIEEIREEAVACAAAGADAIHLHVRDDHGRHSLDPGRYTEAISELDRVLPDFPIQVTTESAGLYDVEGQLQCLRELRPKAASISVKEIARSPELAPYVYGMCRDEGVSVQHILYDPADWERLAAWCEKGIVRDGQIDVLFVMGSYAPPRPASWTDVNMLAPRLQDIQGRAMVCAFGASEHEVLRAAAALGVDLRVGFENNVLDPNGNLASSNAANVARLRAALTGDLAAAVVLEPMEGVSL